MLVLLISFYKFYPKISSKCKIKHFQSTSKIPGALLLVSPLRFTNHLNPAFLVLVVNNVRINIGDAVITLNLVKWKAMIQNSIHLYGPFRRTWLTPTFSEKRAIDIL